eukprot:CAMPEP_0194411130 /NCGR_PEP_ID=MMETSP0176-20130528/9231_1 /TAXON_ID=216777 /ORGANISM="Proboscia alata, Strain PI-D3" /LENGTH=73 /DNA_ID=CAMNT_0039212859 /DNA_START=69 /DNA_END=290 /DNA_ORIENTATION=-
MARGVLLEEEPSRLEMARHVEPLPNTNTSVVWMISKHGLPFTSGSALADECVADNGVCGLVPNSWERLLEALF